LALELAAFAGGTLIATADYGEGDWFVDQLREIG
jgi:hypothetical protein